MIYYIRDEEGSLIGFKYNNNTYYYLKNIEEDIIGITDSNNNKLCSYEYDSWGKIISIKDNNNEEITGTSHIAYINPFRYRSYYYDEETKLYYLNSRYYNPEWGRFINADNLIKAEQNKYNLYTYCKNNPVNSYDVDGKTAGVLGGLWEAGKALREAILAIGASIKGAALPPLAIGTVGLLLYTAVTLEFPESKKKTKKDSYTVYVLRDPNITGADGKNKVEYVGRTTNEAQRKAAHQRNPYKATLKFERVKTDLSYAEARGLEEGLILKYKTLNKGNYRNNQIHGISPRNPKYDFYMNASEKYLLDETYVGGSKW